MRCTSVTIGETSATRAMLVIKLMTSHKRVISLAKSSKLAMLGQTHLHILGDTQHKGECAFDFKYCRAHGRSFEQPHSMDYELAARTEVSALRLRATIVQSQLALNYASNLFQGTVFSSTQHPRAIMHQAL